MFSAAAHEMIFTPATETHSILMFRDVVLLLRFLELGVQVVSHSILAIAQFLCAQLYIQWALRRVSGTHGYLNSSRVFDILPKRRFTTSCA